MFVLGIEKCLKTVWWKEIHLAAIFNFFLNLNLDRDHVYKAAIASVGLIQLCRTRRSFRSGGLPVWRHCLP